MADFGPTTQPSTPTEKASTARAAMGGDEPEKAGGHKFNNIRIERAENGVNIEHSHPHSHPRKRGPEGGGGIDLDHSHTSRIVVPHDHPIMKHVQAIHDHVASQSDCAAGSGHCKG